jgi:hypothetical protein
VAEEGAGRRPEMAGRRTDNWLVSIETYNVSLGSDRLRIIATVDVVAKSWLECLYLFLCP